MTEMKLFKVGGCVRDKFLGRTSKDIDFAVECPEGFDAMVEELERRGAKIFVTTPQFLTARAKLNGEDADFVLCRKDSDESDGRRPDFVEPGTLMDDLARRDFRMNAIAEDVDTGEIIDPFDGQADIKNKRIRCVGDPTKRFEEDALRIVRAFRFKVTLGFTIEDDTRDTMNTPKLVKLMKSVSAERRRDELGKMFAVDSLEAMRTLLNIANPDLREAIMEGINFQPTMKERIT